MAIVAAMTYGVPNTIVNVPNIVVPTDIKMQFALYDSVRYAEYTLLNPTDDVGITVTVNAAYEGVGIYMIAPGARGTVATSSAAGNGGAGGIEQTSTVALPVGTYRWTVTRTVTKIEQTAGSGFTSINLPNTGSAKATGTPYRLYGNANYPCGTITAKTNGGTYAPGKGATGCTLTPIRAQDSMYPSCSTAYGYLTGSIGHGAGGNGGGRTNVLTSTFSGYDMLGYGAPGLIMMRVLW